MFDFNGSRYILYQGNCCKCDPDIRGHFSYALLASLISVIRAGSYFVKLNEILAMMLKPNGWLS